MPTTHPIEAIVVVVPARDEEELLAASLGALEIAAMAARAAGIEVQIVVVLDACRDASADIAAAADVMVIEIDECSAAAGRNAGVDAALELFADVPPERIWTAHTDADSIVPPHWLTHQLSLARRGAVAVAGTVRPDFSDLTPEQTDAWWAAHTPGVADGRAHGANLGVRADALRDAGGFPRADREDIALVDALRGSGAEVVASDAAWVRTSGRAARQAGRGYAERLRDDLLRAAADGIRRVAHPISMI